MHLTIQTVTSRQLVVQADDAALASGVRAGMTAAQARALVPGTIVHLHEHRADLNARALEGLARWMLRVTPRVAVDGADGLVLDLTGCARLHPDEAALMQRIHRAFDRVGYRVHMAAAGTPGTAWGTARYGVQADAQVMTVASDRGAAEPPWTAVDAFGVRVAGGDEREAMSRLPVRALRCPDAVIDELAQVGIEWIADLFRVPRHELAGRGSGWRPDGMLGRLDQVVGRRPEMIEPILPPRRPMAECVFDGPVLQPEAIILTVRELLARLVGELEELGAGVTRLDLQCTSPDLGPQAFRITLGHPTRSMRHLWTLLAPRLERIHLDHGIDAVRMQVSRMARMHEQQAAGLGMERPIQRREGQGRASFTATSASAGSAGSAGSAESSVSARSSGGAESARSVVPAGAVDPGAQSAAQDAGGGEQSVEGSAVDAATGPDSEASARSGRRTIASGASNQLDEGQSDLGGGSPASNGREPDGDTPTAESHQLDPAERRRQEAGVAALVDTLIDRLGGDRVLRWRATHSHVPECVVQSMPASESDPIRLRVEPPGGGGTHVAGARDAATGAGGSAGTAVSVGVPTPATAPTPGAEMPGVPPPMNAIGDGIPIGRPVFSPAGEAQGSDPQWCTTAFHRRPSVMVEPPERLDMEPPMFHWRGQRRRIVTAIGPERIGAPWWSGRRLPGGGRGADPTSATLIREYLRVQDERGCWWWIFRRCRSGSRGGGELTPGARSAGWVSSAGGNAWYLHGIWG
ncbi:MAG: DNA polymerase Y family protein [Phycisphaerales bacterium]